MISGCSKFRGIISKQHKCRNLVFNSIPICVLRNYNNEGDFRCDGLKDDDDGVGIGALCCVVVILMMMLVILLLNCWRWFW